jgi:predicted ATP-dependent endonuclease of OLD family
MNLNTLKYIEPDQDGNEWSINDFSFGKINLLVGQNSTGKSRTLNVINALGRLLAGEQQVQHSGQFYPTFKDDNDVEVRYSLDHCDNRVIQESLEIGNEQLLKRANGGKGTIYAKQLDQEIKFQVPDTILASVAKRDAIQHPFFEQLYQ